MSLVGTYVLRSFTIDGREPWGAASGQISYREDGTMSAVLGPAERAPLGTSPSKASDADWLAATRSFVAYAGRWELDGDVVSHHVEVALIPDWVGTTLRREVSTDAEGDLVLTVVGGSGRLVWRRL